MVYVCITVLFISYFTLTKQLAFADNSRLFSFLSCKYAPQAIVLYITYNNNYNNNNNNLIYNQILDHDWLSARLFVMLSACNHVGVYIQVFNLISK